MKKAIVYFSIYLVLLFAYPSHTYAQGQSLSIYPPVIQVDTTPPSSPAVPITIQNNNDEDVSLTIQLVPFKTDSISGRIVLMPQLANTGFYPYYKDKIQFLVDAKKTDTITLQPLESKEVDLNINLEKGDPPGDFYYSVVFISQTPGPSDSSVSQIPAGIATNLLLSIGPKDEPGGGISQFTTSSFKTKGPVDFTLKLHNSSKHLIAPTGIINITNIFGKKVGSVNLLSQYILAGGDRYLLDDGQASANPGSTGLQSNYIPKVIWPEKFIFGFYKATASISLEPNSPRFTATTYFFAFPLYFFFPIVIILFVVLSIYLRVKRKI